jgi:hypothetical protein
MILMNSRWNVRSVVDMVSFERQGTSTEFEPIGSGKWYSNIIHQFRDLSQWNVSILSSFHEMGLTPLSDHQIQMDIFHPLLSGIEKQNIRESSPHLCAASLSLHSIQSHLLPSLMKTPTQSSIQMSSNIATNISCQWNLHWLSLSLSFAFLLCSASQPGEQRALFLAGDSPLAHPRLPSLAWPHCHCHCHWL